MVGAAFSLVFFPSNAAASSRASGRAPLTRSSSSSRLESARSWRRRGRRPVGRKGEGIKRARERGGWGEGGVSLTNEEVFFFNTHTQRDTHTRMSSHLSRRKSQVPCVEKPFWAVPFTFVAPPSLYALSFHVKQAFRPQYQETAVTNLFKSLPYKLGSFLYLSFPPRPITTYQLLRFVLNVDETMCVFEQCSNPCSPLSMFWPWFT